MILKLANYFFNCPIRLYIENIQESYTYGQYYAE